MKCIIHNISHRYTDQIHFNLNNTSLAFPKTPDVIVTHNTS